MKTTKRILATLLAVMMLVAMMAIPASAAAAPVTTEGSVTIKSSSNGATYRLYRILDLSKVDEVSKAYSYLKNSTWGDWLAANATSYIEFDGEGNVTNLTLAAGNVNDFADDVANAGKTEDASGTGTGSDLVISNLRYGYYVLASSRTDESADPKYNVFTLASSNLEITEKTGKLPQISKTVNDKAADSVGSEDILTYKVTVKAAAGPAADEYTITDVLPTGISVFTDATHTLTVQKISGGTTYDLTADGADPDYTVISTTNGFEIKLTDSCRTSIMDNDEIVVTYYAKMNDSLVTGASPNTNTATLSYTNAEGNSATETDTAAVYTGKLTFTKVDAANTSNQLSGAEFYLKSGDNFAVITGGIVTGWVASQNDATKLTTAGAAIVIKGLDDGTYTLVETKAPNGYFKADDTTITISESTGTGGVVTGVSEVEKTIQNTKGTELPETGGIGTTIFYVIGVVLVLAAVSVLVIKKRRSAEQ